jgi:geranylgeranyl pyrophosphate synthase
MDKTQTFSRARKHTIPKGSPARTMCDGFTLPDFFARENIAAVPGVTAHLLANEFLEPVREYLNRPRKNFRASLVEIGAQLLEDKGYLARPENLSLIKDAMECLHAGSLIVDDIQDGSVERRGHSSFHVQHGAPQAICSGNWMYFWPLRLLAGVQWSPDSKLRAYECFHRALELAHYGQFLDLTTKASETSDPHLSEISMRTAELKTGTITALAFELGALAAGVGDEHLATVSSFGNQFGLALQRLDDWGNLRAAKAKAKRFEDLLTEKPTTVWHDVVTCGDEHDSTSLRQAAARLPDREPVLSWLTTSKVPARAHENITQALQQACNQLSIQLGLSDESKGISRLKIITEELLDAYQ